MEIIVRLFRIQRSWHPQERNHVNHVTTQLPYAATVAVVSCITYVIAGFVQNALICLPIGMVLLVAALLLMKKRTESHS